MIFGGRADEPEPVGETVRELSEVHDRLVKQVEHGGLDGFTGEQRVRFVQDFERLRNTMALVDHAVITDAIVHDLPGELGQSSMTRVLTQALRISAGEASRRVLAAAQVGERVSMTGQRMDPVRPVLAAAQRAGDVSPEQVHIIVKGLGSVDRAGFDPADISTGEQIATDAAVQVGPKDLQGLTDRIVEAINPDGSRPREELNADRRYFHLRQTKDGAYRGSSG